MKIEKAVEILDNYQCDLPRDEVCDLLAALQLGIEALKLIQHLRSRRCKCYSHNLPSETRIGLGG